MWVILIIIWILIYMWWYIIDNKLLVFYDENHEKWIDDDKIIEKKYINSRNILYILWLSLSLIWITLIFTI